MSLKLYKQKRDFKSTPEPTGGKASSEKLSFVVQRHKASRLHYDFRLEMGGVLKSWAVPKGPSLFPGDKRLAMMTEDHPYDYKDFSGVIPDGYGAGIVEIWDKGWCTDLEKSDRNLSEKNLLKLLEAGSLKFVLHGKKLKGEFALVKIKNKKGDKDNAWLLIKHNDKYAVEEAYDSEAYVAKNSPINKFLAEEKKPSKKKFYKARIAGKKVTHPIKPMLAKEREGAFDDAGWLFEIKWDGYRAIAEVDNGQVQLYSRNGNSFNEDYPSIINSLEEIKQEAVLDGEVVVVNAQGHAEFQALQHYDPLGDAQILFYAFDLLRLNGIDMYDLPLLQRKELLQHIIPAQGLVKYSDHVAGKGKDFYDLALKQDLEGIMAKKLDSVYQQGARTANWLKIKQHKTDEVVIVGYTEPTGNRPYFGALVLATKQDKILNYAGHTGTGFSDAQLKEIYDLLRAIKTKNSPFSAKVKTNMPVTWVKPIYIAEIKFTEKTKDGKMRHPVFLRMRLDK